MPLRRLVLEEGIDLLLARDRALGSEAGHRKRRRPVGEAHSTVEIGTSQFADEWAGGAAVHQFGGTIKPKSGKLLAFRGHVAKSVTIPARPYLGLSDADQNELVERTLDWLRTSGGLK